MRRLRNGISGIGGLFGADRFLWAVGLILGRGFTKSKSIFYGWVLGTSDLHLGPGSIVRGTKYIRFGARFYAHGHVWIEAVSSYGEQRFSPRIEFGEDVSMSDAVHITCIDRISIAKGTLLGSRVYISDHQHGVYKGNRQSSPFEIPTQRKLGGGGPVSIGENCWIGDNVVIVGPISIGSGAIIGANSVVRNDIPDNTMVAGAPARPIKRFDLASGEWIRIMPSNNSLSMVQTMPPL